GSPRSQETILGDRPTQTRFKRLSKQPNEPPLSRVNTLGSGEDSVTLIELMKLCTKLSERVFTLENIKTARDLEITNLKKRVKRLKRGKSQEIHTSRGGYSELGYSILPKRVWVIKRIVGILDLMRQIE
nr:hypothetical protein [Tanacetum cinerariifolium]